jgi:hypothetical protein
MFAISGRNIPPVRSYAHALEVWEGAHQHKRFGENSRGLVNARNTSQTVRKDGDRICFYYHSTCMVAYSPATLQLATYDSQSSITFSSYLVPIGFGVRSSKGEMYIIHDGRWLMPSRGSLHFDLVDGKYVLHESTAAAFDHYTLDKKKAAAVRAAIKPFRERRDALLRLRNGRNEATINNRAQLAHVLKSTLTEPIKVGEQEIADLMHYQPAYDDDFLLPTAYLVGGAVRKETSLCGPRSDNKYATNPARLYI